MNSAGQQRHWPNSWPAPECHRGDRIAVWHRDSAAIHILFVAIERCGAIAVGIGVRAGTREVAAILRSAQPRMLVSDGSRCEDAARAAAAIADFSVPIVLLNQTGGVPRLDLEPAPSELPPGRLLGPDDVFLTRRTAESLHR